MSVRYALGCAALIVTTGISHAQSSPPADSWLLQNYRFAGPPPPGEIKPSSPVISELQEIQNTILAILRKANFAGDFEAALAAAAQATANAQLRDSIIERQQSARAKKTALDEPPSKSPLYLIAMKNRSIQAATSWWADGLMLHYITLAGAHEQVRLDLVDQRYPIAVERRR